MWRDGVCSTPSTSAPSTPGGKLFTVFYVFAGVGIIFAFVEAVARASLAQRSKTPTPLRGRPRTPEFEKEDPSNPEEEVRE
jgi:hypothetical protein